MIEPVTPEGAIKWQIEAKKLIKQRTEKIKEQISGIYSKRL